MDEKSQNESIRSGVTIASRALPLIRILVRAGPQKTKDRALLRNITRQQLQNELG
jgi:hypothetical protein